MVLRHIVRESIRRTTNQESDWSVLVKCSFDFRLSDWLFSIQSNSQKHLVNLVSTKSCIKVAGSIAHFEY